jgi:hypothetical protein
MLKFENIGPRYYRISKISFLEIAVASRHARENSSLKIQLVLGLDMLGN